MARPFDLILGASLGLVAGAIFHRTFKAAWRWGFDFLGPMRPSELHPKPRDVPGRTVVRDVLASLAAGATVGATWLALTLPFRSLVEVWRHFSIAWLTAFLLVSRAVSIRRRKDAA